MVPIVCIAAQKYSSLEVLETEKCSGQDDPLRRQCRFGII